MQANLNLWKRGLGEQNTGDENEISKKCRDIHTVGLDKKLAVKDEATDWMHPEWHRYLIRMDEDRQGKVVWNVKILRRKEELHQKYGRAALGKYWARSKTNGIFISSFGFIPHISNTSKDHSV